MKSADIWIGLDPGKKTGIGIWDREKKSFKDVTSGDFFKATKIVSSAILQAKTEGLTVRLRLEDTRKASNVFRGESKYTVLVKKLGHLRALRAAISLGKDVGKVDRDCELWESWAKNHGIEIDLVSPSSRRRGVDLKLKADRFQRITGWKKRTNEHGRDAAMLVYGK